VKTVSDDIWLALDVIEADSHIRPNEITPRMYAKRYKVTYASATYALRAMEESGKLKSRIVKCNGRATRAYSKP
jgi:ribosomal protein S25